MTITTTITCNKCGNEINEHAPHWTATFVERSNPDATVPAICMYPQPTRVDVCTECVQEVLGPLIRNARGPEPEPNEVQALILKTQDEPLVGYFVPPGTDNCPNCGDTNFNESDRLCISCNHDHPDHHIPQDCEHFCRNRK